MGETEHNQIFRAWLKDHQGLIFKVVRSFAREEFDQEDLFQEISIKVWKSIPQYKGEAALTTWIYRVALNAAISWNRKEKRRVMPQDSLNEVERVISENNQNPDDRLDWLYSEIVKLNDIDRSIALLLLDDYSYQEMAEMLGISANNVGVKVHRIKQHLIAQSEKISYHGI